MGEGNAAIQSGGELRVVGGGGSVMTHTAGSLTLVRTAIKKVIAWRL